MIFNTKATQKNAGQKLTDIFLEKGKLNELWSELDETCQATVSGGVTGYNGSLGITVLGSGEVAFTFLAKKMYTN